MGKIHKELDLTNSERIFFIGDVHGQYDALQFALESLGFSDNDALISVGDVIDRGKKSLECLLFFKHAPNAHMVRGNHEDFFFQSFLEDNARAKAAWLWNGGDWSEQYHKDILKGIAEELKDMPYTLTVTHGDTTFGVCHAEAPHKDWDVVIRDERFSTLQNLMWERDRIDEDDVTISGVTFTVHGHTPRKTVTKKGNQHWIDTGAQDIQTGDYRMTIFEWNDGKFTEHSFGYDTLSRQYQMFY